MSPKRSLTLGKTIGNNICSLRHKKYPGRGSQTRCASDFGVRPAEWSKWENNKRTPTDETQERLAVFFGVTVAELRGELLERHENASPITGEAKAVTMKLLSTLADVHRMLGDIGLAVTEARADAGDALRTAEAVRDIIRRARDKQVREDMQLRSGSDTRDIGTSA